MACPCARRPRRRGAGCLTAGGCGEGGESLCRAGRIRAGWRRWTGRGRRQRSASGRRREQARGLLGGGETRGGAQRGRGRECRRLALGRDRRRGGRIPGRHLDDRMDRSRLMIDALGVDVRRKQDPEHPLRGPARRAVEERRKERLTGCRCPQRLGPRRRQGPGTGAETRHRPVVDHRDRRTGASRRRAVPAGRHIALHARASGKTKGKAQKEDDTGHANFSTRRRTRRPRRAAAITCSGRRTPPTRPPRRSQGVTTTSPPQRASRPSPATDAARQPGDSR